MKTLQTIFSSRLKFPKPVAEYKLLDFFGKNVLTTEFAEWKQHRRIVAGPWKVVGDPGCGIRTNWANFGVNAGSF